MVPDCSKPLAFKDFNLWFCQRQHEFIFKASGCYLLFWKVSQGEDEKQLNNFIKPNLWITKKTFCYAVTIYCIVRFCTSKNLNTSFTWAMPPYGWFCEELAENTLMYFPTNTSAPWLIVFVCSFPTCTELLHIIQHTYIITNLIFITVEHDSKVDRGRLSCKKILINSGIMDQCENV